MALILTGLNRPPFASIGAIKNLSPVGLAEIIPSIRCAVLNQCCDLPIGVHPRYEAGNGVLLGSQLCPIRHEPASHCISRVIFSLEPCHSLQKIRDFLSIQALFDLAIAFGVAFLTSVRPRPVGHLFRIHSLPPCFALGSLTTTAGLMAVVNADYRGPLCHS
jgi:hypothetical protein